MELKFINITKSSKKIYYEFLDFHNKKFGKKESIQTFLIFFAIIYMIVFNVKNGNFFFPIIIALILLLAGFFQNVLHKEKAVKKELGSSKIKNQEEITYNFYNLYFDVIKNNKKNRIWYIKLHKIHQDKNNFYFYLDSTHALLIDKKGFVKGTLSEFKEFISKRCIFKYNKLKKEKIKNNKK